MNMIKTTKLLCLALVGWVGCAAYATETEGEVLDEASAWTYNKSGYLTNSVSGWAFVASVNKGNYTLSNAKPIKSITSTIVDMSKLDGEQSSIKITTVSLKFSDKGVHTNITFLALPKTITTFGSQSLINCPATMTIDFNNAPITSLPTSNSAFNGCKAQFKNLNLSQLTTLAKASAFQGCPGLIGELVLSKLGSVVTSGFNNSDNITRMVLPVATQISPTAFRYCDGLTELVIPRMTSLGYLFVDDAPKFKEIKLPYCIAKLPAKSTSAYNKTFEGSSLTNVFLHVKSPLAMNNLNEDGTINTNAIKTASGLSRSDYIIPYGGVVENEAYTNETDKISVVWFYDDRDTPGYDLSDTITITGSTNAMGKVVLPEKVKAPVVTVENDVTVTNFVNKKVTAIGMSAFYDRSKITHIRFGRYLERVEMNALPVPTVENGLTLEVPADKLTFWQAELADEYGAAIEKKFIVFDTYVDGGTVIIVR